MAQGWKITFGLSALVVVAALLAPRLKPESPPAQDPDMHADVCVRLGPYECCYDPDQP